MFRHHLDLFKADDHTFLFLHQICLDVLVKLLNFKLRSLPLYAYAFANFGLI